MMTLSWVMLAVLTLGHRSVQDEKAIENMVLEAQKAGYESHDLKAYMNQWSEDAHIVFGRSQKAGKYDSRVGLKRIRGTRLLRYQARRRAAEMLKHKGAVVRIKKDRAELTVETTAFFPNGWEVVGEIYRLRKTDQGWKVYENRWWPKSLRTRAGTTNFTPEHWKKMDAHVERAKKNGSLRGVLDALLNAYRVAEAWEVTGKMTARSGATAQDWVTRGDVGMRAQRPDAAMKAYRKALSLDPDAHVPSYAKKK